MNKRDIDTIIERKVDEIARYKDEILFNLYRTLSEKHKEIKSPKFYHSTKIENETDESLTLSIRLTIFTDKDEIIDFMDSKIIINMGDINAK